MAFAEGRGGLEPGQQPAGGRAAVLVIDRVGSLMQVKGGGVAEDYQLEQRGAD